MNLDELIGHLEQWRTKVGGRTDVLINSHVGPTLRILLIYYGHLDAVWLTTGDY